MRITLYNQLKRFEHIKYDLINDKINFDEYSKSNVSEKSLKNRLLSESIDLKKYDVKKQVPKESHNFENFLINLTKRNESKCLQKQSNDMKNENNKEKETKKIKIKKNTTNLSKKLDEEKDNIKILELKQVKEDSKLMQDLLDSSSSSSSSSSSKSENKELDDI